MKNLAIIIVTLFLFFPKFTIYENAYQDSLWTYDNFTKSTKTNDIIIKSKGKIDDIEKWYRIRLGFPTSAITIDLQLDSTIIQSRAEPKYIIINLILSVILISFIWLIKFLTNTLKRKNYS